VLLAFIVGGPESGYSLKKRFSTSPAGVYQPSPGAMYPALRRLVARGLLSVEETVSRGRRELRLYHVTEAGRAVHLDWLRQPVDPATVVSDLGMHLMRFAMMEGQLETEEVLAFLKGLADALDGFVSGVERYLASGAQASRRHAQLALQHGIAMHRASLEWASSAMAALAGPPDRHRAYSSAPDPAPSPDSPRSGGSRSA
jgi:PadR family transcriptional regulator, regulatory protein AphA